MLNVHYRSALGPRVTERQSAILEHRRMAELARPARTSPVVRVGRLLARVATRLLRRRRPDPSGPEVTIWLDPAGSARWAPAAAPAPAGDAVAAG